MQVGDMIEFGPGLVAKVVWPGDAMWAECFIMKYDGKFVACEGDATEFWHIFEDAWRDSFADAMRDIELANEMCD